MLLKALSERNSMLNNKEGIYELDIPLGVIHEIAFKLQFLGHTELALMLVEAHEQIQKWLIKEIE